MFALEPATVHRVSLSTNGGQFAERFKPGTAAGGRQTGDLMIARGDKSARSWLKYVRAFTDTRTALRELARL